MERSASDGAASADGAAMRELTLPLEDGWVLQASFFAPPAEATTRPAITVIAPGAAIPRSFYARFAAYLAGRGETVLTFDYRAIGGSRQGSLARSTVLMRDWCLRDVPGVLAFLARSHPGRPIHWVGHSMGGFATGLAPNNELIARQLNVATLSGYWGRFAVPERYRVYVLMGLLAPAIIAACGYLPGRLMGGADMPGPAFLEWRRWCLEPDFLFGDPTLPGKENFARLTAPLCAAQIADDPWGTPAAVGHMLEKFSGSRDRVLWRIDPATAGLRRIGHFGFFRPDARSLWKSAADWLAGEPLAAARG